MLVRFGLYLCFLVGSIWVLVGFYVCSCFCFSSWRLVFGFFFYLIFVGFYVGFIWISIRVLFWYDLGFILGYGWLFVGSMWVSFGFYVCSMLVLCGFYLGF